MYSGDFEYRTIIMIILYNINNYNIYNNIE